MKGDKGDKGDTGTAGVAGSDGTDGADGIDGMDAAWGDGSAGTKTFVFNSTFHDSNPQYDDFVVDPGVTLSVRSGTIIRCRGKFINEGTLQVLTAAPGSEIKSNSSLDISGYRYSPIHPGVSARAAALGNHHRTNGVFLNYGRGGHRMENPAAIVRPPVYAGGAGGSIATQGVGSKGGGSVAIYCKGGITNNGLIRANGSNGTFGGAGAGGIIILASEGPVEGTGLIEAKGGNGSAASVSYGPGGGGGGGLVHVLAPDSNLLNPVNVDVSGGAGQSAAPVGTVDNSLGTHGGPGGGACAGNGGRGGWVNSDGSTIASESGDNGLLIFREIVTPAGLLN